MVLLRNVLPWLLRGASLDYMPMGSDDTRMRFGGLGSLLLLLEGLVRWLPYGKCQPFIRLVLAH